MTEKEGTYFLSTMYNKSGTTVPDNTGIAVSPTVNLVRDTVTFVAAGGDGDCVVSLFNKNNELLKSETIENEHFERFVWNVDEYIGKDVYFKISDNSSACGVSIDIIRIVNSINESGVDSAAVEGYYSGYVSSIDSKVTAKEFISAVVHASGNLEASEDECITIAKTGNIRVGDTSASAGKVKFYRESDGIDLDSYITRGQAALMLSRLYDRDAQGDARRADPDNINRIRYESLISDFESISDETIKTAVTDVYALGIMTTQNGEFGADEYITGKEASGAIVRAFDSAKCYSDYVTDEGFYLPTVFGNYMVIQRNKPIHIWGQGVDGDKINISITSEDGLISVSNEAIVAGGKWDVILNALNDTTKTYNMTVSNGGLTQKYNDILVGEVWFISGQSNMQTPVNAYMNTAINGNIRAQGEDAASYSGKIRYFNQAHSYADEEKSEVRRGVWKECNAANVWNFSATGYMFARNLYDMLEVPIGLVYAAQGSTGIQTWMSKNSIETDELVRERVYENNHTALGSAGKAPAKFYNAMISPVKNLSVGGILWYQGESNAASDGAFYENLLKAHINGLRNEFYNGINLPFVFMQLAPYTGLDYTGVREGMRKVTESLDNVQMAVQIDWLDDSLNPEPIHPYNKALVGERLAKAAYGMVYGGGLNGYVSPSFDDISVNGSEITVSLKNVGEGIKTFDGSAPTAFMIAGSDESYVQAEAEIIGTDMVKIWCDEISNPKYVRYAYEKASVQDNSKNNFIFGSTNLPLGPFEASVND